MARAIQSQVYEQTPRRIFFRRGNVTFRKIANVEDVTRMLKEDFGFSIIDPSGMTVEDQIALMKNAEIVVGGHGAALTNVCFAPSGCWMTELFTLQQMKFYRAACEILGVSHSYFAGTPVGDIPERPDNADYTIDIAALREKLLTRLPQ